MKINEIFYSIQGEGKWTGLPNVFIRVTGCNLRCFFCDTKYAYYEGEEMAIDEIMNRILTFNNKFICITGGEPLIQKDIIELLDLLINRKYCICLETNGSINIDGIVNKKNLLISMDIKCPSSKMHNKMCFENISLLNNHHQLKMIINDEKDYNYAKKILQDYKPECTVFFQPVWGSNPTKLANWIKDDKLIVRLGIQLHKFLWGNQKGT